VRAEADVHIGYLAIRAARPDAALPPLETAAASDDPYVRYLAEHFRGRALEALNRRDDAIGAYRRALAIVPNAPSTATLLAAQLFAAADSDGRAQAHAVLETANAASPRPTDPWDFYWQGDARLWPVYMDRLREDLRR
jgi:tetratricopeptide (TPR) repeat protein